jgi:hypothetical protein
MYAPHVIAATGAAVVAAEASPARDLGGFAGAVLLVALRIQEALIGLWLVLFALMLMSAWVSRWSRRKGAAPRRTMGVAEHPSRVVAVDGITS